MNHSRSGPSAASRLSRFRNVENSPHVHRQIHDHGVGANTGWNCLVIPGLFRKIDRRREKRNGELNSIFV